MCNLARLLVLFLALPLLGGGHLHLVLLLLHRLSVQAVDSAFLRDRGLRSVALVAHPCKRNQVRIKEWGEE